MSARLLIVDDEVAQMKALCRTLEAEGYHCTGYSTPTEALDQLRSGEYELLLTDLMMPEMDGVALIRAARQIDTDLAAVVMTGHGTIDTAVSAMQVGASDYVLKPFKLSVILTVIARALDVRQLRIDNIQLQKREQERAIELTAAYQDLESFAYSVSHDLRAPLRAIRGFTDLYLDEFGASIPPEGRHTLDHVVAGAKRMDELIEDLLKFCRFSRTPLAKSRVDVGAMARRVIADLTTSEQPRQVAVEIGDLPPCEADPSLFEQVIANLLSNAFKFTRERPQPRISIGSYESAGKDDGSSERVYFVRDNGAGFDMKYADKLFGVFQRLHTQERFPGTGVGLSIVQRILHRHGGRIWVESAPDQGATFYFVVQR